MNLLKRSPITTKGCAPETDYRQLMSECADQLHWLAYVLTGDSDEADECFVSGLGECLHFNQVFKEWTGAWSRRAIIKNAIRMVHPRYGTDDGMMMLDEGQIQSPGLAWLTGNLLALPAFDRFVFVKSILEGYKEHECAALINCPFAQVSDARTKALQKIAQAAIADAESTQTAPASQEPVAVTA